MENKFIPSFFSGIDRSIGGFAKKQLTIIAGSPTSGKTAFMINSALRQSTNNQPPYIFSLEMDSIKCGRIMKEMFYEDRKSDSDLHFKYILSQPYFYDLGSNHLSDILQEIKFAAYALNHEMFWIDYLQLVSADGNTRADEVENILSSLKEIAEEYNIAIAITYQLSHASENQLPALSQLCNTSSILKHASKIIYIKPSKPFSPSMPTNARTLFVSDSTNEIFGTQSFTIDSKTRRVTEL